MENSFILSWMIHWLNVKLVECKILALRIIFLKNMKTRFFDLWFPVLFWGSPVAFSYLGVTCGPSGSLWNLFSALCSDISWACVGPISSDSTPSWTLAIGLFGSFLCGKFSWTIYLIVLAPYPTSLPFRTVIGICIYVIGFPSLYA